MKLSKEIIDLIEKEYEDFKADMYANSPKEVRDELGQFFTPAGAAIQMLEILPEDALDGNILDPTSGSGNLLAAALIAGADSDKVFGNEYDPRMVKACRERLNKVCDMLGKPHIRDWQIHRGDAMDKFCLQEFGPDYKDKLRQYYLDNQNSLFPILTDAQETFLTEVD